MLRGVGLKKKKKTQIPNATSNHPTINTYGIEREKNTGHMGRRKTTF